MGKIKGSRASNRKPSYTSKGKVGTIKTGCTFWRDLIESFCSNSGKTHGHKERALTSKERKFKKRKEWINAQDNDRVRHGQRESQPTRPVARNDRRENVVDVVRVPKANQRLA